jgi:hypothetical protein
MTDVETELAELRAAIASLHARLARLEGGVSEDAGDRYVVLGSHGVGGVNDAGNAPTEVGSTSNQPTLSAYNRSTGSAYAISAFAAGPGPAITGEAAGGAGVPPGGGAVTGVGVSGFGVGSGVHGVSSAGYGVHGEGPDRRPR